MKISHILFLIFLFTSIVYSDGIPVDRKTKRVLVPHTIIQISENQIEEIEAMGTVTLTDIQWKQLRKIGSSCPKRFENVLPVTWNDCTCGIDVYVIQMEQDKIAIPHDQIDGKAGIELEHFLEGSPEMVSLSVDHRGQFYYKGTLIPFDALISTISTSKIKISDNEEYGKQRFLFVHKPLGMDIQSPQLSSRLTKLYEIAKHVGLSIPNEGE